MADCQSAAMAIEGLNQTSINGKEISVQVANGRNQHKPQRDYGGYGRGNYDSHRKGSSGYRDGN